ncbi:MAG: hypothetical protein AAB906_00770 [Patescibacteria group bacterium]
MPETDTPEQLIKMPQSEYCRDIRINMRDTANIAISRGWVRHDQEMIGIIPKSQILTGYEPIEGRVLAVLHIPLKSIATIFLTDKNGKRRMFVNVR